MANTGKTVATLLIGAAVGAAVGYILATDKDKRQEGMERIRDRFADFKNKFSKGVPQDLEEEIYNA
ncbi:MAG TPA: YtxH domain-containing protein [Flavipsychrobacter sp.]|nr:YtxH domain-containing protein [Flavipsychrobacter sp.]